MTLRAENETGGGEIPLPQPKEICMSDPNKDEMDNRDFREPNQSEWDEQPDFIEPCYYDDNDGDQEYRAYMYGSGRY
jgi:hypothetical protein